MAVQEMTRPVSLRARFYRQLDPEARTKPGLSATNIAIISLVMMSFVAMALETEPTLGDNWRNAINVFNLAILGIFAVEYVARVWSEGEDPRFRGVFGRLRFMVQPYALADLIAFLPELLWVIFVSATGNEEGVMLLRVLRLARLVKIARFVPAMDVLGDTLKRSGTQLLTTLIVAMTLVFVAALMLYYIEGVIEGRDEFNSIPRAIWWAIATLTTVGYGDVYPITPLGKIAASLIALAGIGVVALPAGVFASAFSDELRERDQEKRRARMQAAEAALSSPEDEDIAVVDAPETD